MPKKVTFDVSHEAVGGLIQKLNDATRSAFTSARIQFRGPGGGNPVVSLEIDEPDERGVTEVLATNLCPTGDRWSPGDWEAAFPGLSLPADHRGR